MKARLRFVSALLLCAVPAAAQTATDVRNEIRQILRENSFSTLLASTAHLGIREDLGSATEVRLDDTARTRYAFVRFGAPKELGRTENGDRFGVDWSLAQVSSTLGTGDIFEGESPAIATSFRSKTESIGAQLGPYYRHELGGGWYVRPALDLSLGRIQNRTRYGGPGASAIAPLLDGLLFNWEAWFWGLSGRLRVGYEHAWGEGYRFEAHSGVQLSYLESFDTTDAAQDFHETATSIVTGVQQRGPLGVSLGSAPLYWNLSVHNVLFPGTTGNKLGFHWFNEYGASLEWDISSWKLPLSDVTLSGSYFRGTDLDGFSIGVGVGFGF